MNMNLTKQQNRPLRPGDRLIRETFVMGGKAFWSSIAMRATGAVEIWVRQDDGTENGTAHEGWTFIASIPAGDVAMSCTLWSA
jgi:hypothetical protein